MERWGLWPLCTLEQSDEDVRRRADILPGPPGQQEGLSADQPGRAGLRRVVQAGRQSIELRQVDVREPEQRAVASGQVLSYAPVMGRFQSTLHAKGTKNILFLEFELQILTSINQ